MAAKLTDKMTEALELVDAYGTAGGVHPRTLDALIRRGLIENGAGAAGWNYRVTALGAETFSIVNRRHLNGSFTVRPVTLREQYSDTPARFSPDAIDDVHAFALIENSKLTTTPVVDATPVQYRVRNANTGKTYLVLGTGPARNAPHLTVVWVQAEGEQGASPWNPAEMVSNWHPVVAVDDKGNTQPRTATAHQLYDNTLHKSLIVLGSSVLGVFYRYEDDAINRVRMVLAADLLSGDRYVALCAHHPEKSNPTITVRDEDGYFSITVDRGFGPRLAATVPTGNRAAYPEAIERGMAEAREKVTAIVDDQVRICPDAVVVGWGESAEELAEVSTIPFIEHKIISAQSGWVYRVLGSGDGGIWIERIVGADTASKFVSVCHVTDLSNFTALCEHTDYPSTCPVCQAVADEPIKDAPAHRLYDNALRQSMTILGSSALGIFYRYENDARDRVRMVLAADLLDGDRYTALCAHYYGRMDSCPGCDADEQRTEAIRDAVRLLVSYGIDTPEKFVAAVAALDEEKRQC